jgi:hypothetical protein
VHALSRWVDESTFHAEDPRRRVSAEVEFGATWREQGSNDAWRLSWLRDTGELYRCRTDGYDGSCTDVFLLAVVAREVDVDAMLEGWQDYRTDPDGLAWLGGRVQLLTAA